jgi:hypothetical protein
LPIFGRKKVVFLKHQCYDQLFSKFSFVLSQKRQFFAKFFGENILKIITLVPDEFAKKITANVAQTIFVKINAQFCSVENVTTKIGQFL